MTDVLLGEQTLLSAAEWRGLEAEHFAAVSAYTEPYRLRRSRQEAHPVHDFLFTYYNYSMGKLEVWHPDFTQALENSDRTDKFYKTTEGRTFQNLELLSDGQLRSLRWIRNLLEKTAGRAPNFACHGLHEWAMVHRGQEVRHESCTKLRLPQETIDELVESRPICCSHFDAFRFFAPSAAPLNRLKPTLETREQNEQPACLHANMDLYKWAYRCMPFIGSALLLDCFHLALEIRAIDMRASPYDLSAWGYEAITIETAEGRREYEVHQRELAGRAKVLRLRLLEKIDLLLERVHRERLMISPKEVQTVELERSSSTSA